MSYWYPKPKEYLTQDLFSLVFMIVSFILLGYFIY